jgi:oligoribonuclease NrnB/cAMP/cGMP phosphodiesterase (DHH superfamily)
MKIIGLYHKNCTDGTTAAAVILKKFPDATVISIEHNFKYEDFEQILGQIDEDTIVYIVDFALKPEYLNKVLERAKKVINLDHHISMKNISEEIKDPKFEFVFDNDKSGASLTWHYLFSTESPKIIKYVEDKDIWKWQYGDTTKYVNDYLFLFTNKPEEVKELLDKDITEIIEKGKIINQYTTYLINTFVEKAKDLFIKIGNYKVRAYNTGLFQSEIGNLLATRYNKAVCLFSVNGDYVKLSFRSLDNHNPSALDLAKLLNGGGHRNAAGASVSINEFCSMIMM